MSKSSPFSRLGLVILFISFGALMRVIPHPYNLSPVGAMALLAGAKIRNPWAAMLLPLLALFVSDLYLGFHSTMPYVYGAFIFSVGLSQLFLAKTKSDAFPGVARLLGTTTLSSVSFFAISNLGVWHLTSLYPKSAAGILETYVAAIPFYPATLMGDLFYSFAFFGALAWLSRSSAVPSNA